MAHVKEELRGPCGSWGPAQEEPEGVEPGPRLKEEEPELCIKQEPQEFPFHMVTVKSEDDEDKSSVLHQRPTEEKREETNVWECGAEAGCSSVCEGEHLKVEEEEELLDGEEEGAESDGSWDWEPPLRQTLSERRTASTMEPKPDFSSPSEKQKLPRRSYRDTSLRDKTPYHCAACGKKFRFRCLLQRHLVCHTEKKSHECPVSDKRFTLKDCYLYSLQSYPDPDPDPNPDPSIHLK